MLLGVLAFSEARADVRPSDQQCDSLSNHLLAGVEALSQFTNLFKNAQSQDERNRIMNGVDIMRQQTAEWATIYNAACKD